jgi:hypothetical protein
MQQHGGSTNRKHVAERPAAAVADSAAACQDAPVPPVEPAGHAPAAKD